MSTRTLTNTVNPDIIALNAAIFGYAGHSVLTPHAAIQQIWWTEARIAEKVTPEFVNSKLRPEARANLNFAIGFGDGLTDDTYMEWILSRAKRMFLILVECAVPEQIYGIVDDSWDDDDLPISQDDVERLAQRDYRLSKFYTAQFQFLLRQLTEDSHIDYAPNEVVPLDYIHRLPPAAALQRWSRVHMPKAPERVYVRRKMSLDENDESRPTREQFLADVETAQSIKNEHIAPVYATYTAKNSAYFLTPFVAEHTLKSFIDFRTPASMAKVDKARRCAILLQWLHCLADAICSVHEYGMCHTAITPSNILVDAENNVAFSDIGSLKSFQLDKRMDPNEAYNYSAPEAHTSLQSSSSEAIEEAETLPPLKSKSRFFHRRKKSNESRATSHSSSSASSSSRGQSYAERQSHITAPRSSIDSQATYLPMRTNTHTSSIPSSTVTRVPSTSASGRTSYKSNRETMILVDKALPPTPTTATVSWSDTSSSLGSTVSMYADSTMTTMPRSLILPPPVSEQADVFALGCIFLDILTFALSPKHGNAFVKFRSSKIAKSAKGGNSGRPGTSQGFTRSGSTAINASLRPVGKVDSSFHANLTRVGEWIGAIEHDAFDREEGCFRAYPQLLDLVRVMVQTNPALRPSAEVVRERVASGLKEHALIDVDCERCAASTADYGGEVPTVVQTPERQRSSRPSTALSNTARPIGLPSVPGRPGRTQDEIAPAPGVPLAAGRSGLEGRMGGLSVEEGVKRPFGRRKAVGVS